jgi:uncharacterized protein (TIGR02594 family)
VKKMKVERHFSRKAFLEGALSTLTFARLALAQDEEWKKDLEAYLRTQDKVTLGHIIPPINDETWKKAHEIVSHAPEMTEPYKVAEYFKTSVPERYQMSWPEPDRAHPTLANPLIVLFFASTRTAPAGDTTAWCAAFVNWCLSHAGIEGTRSAKSQSFLDWGMSVWSKGDNPMPAQAKMGDIAIFRHQSNPEKGHVCFFRNISNKQPKSIEVIGGNQIRGQGKNKIHLIDVVTMRVDEDLELFSVRTAKGLRNA